jgi:hypothetical protein
MTASQSREMTLNNENNNQSTVNQTLGARLKTVNLTTILTVNNQQVETSKQTARINKTVNLSNFYKISNVETWVWRQY